MELSGMQFDDVPSISDGLAGMIGRNTDPEPANLRLATAVSGGGGTGLASVYVGSASVPAVVGCVCAAEHAANERLVLVAQGPNYVCIGSLDRGKTAYAEAADSVSMTFTAVTVQNAAITFPAGRFTVAPLVLATIQSAAGGTQKMIPRAISVTTSGASIYVYTGDSTATTANVVVAWHAIQMTPTSAAG